MFWELVYKATVYIAEEMGLTLKKSAFSPNIRERVDLSCAVTDSEGRIVAQAEHIPVHLGSFRVGVFNVLKWLEREGVELGEGDIIVVNDPYLAGTHLNDVMMLSPVYIEGKLIGYVVNKAHYVDVGGPIPGSMNPYAKTIYEEGVVIPPTKIVKRGSIDREVVRFITENSKASKTVEGDIYAQIASIRYGVSKVVEMVNRFGLENVLSCWLKAIEYGRVMTVRGMERWRRGVYEAEDYLELGDRDIVIRAKVTVRDSGIDIDFTGSSPQVEAPLNAVYGVTFSACAYAVRVALDTEPPVNEGFYSTINVYAPQGTVVNPLKPAAVGAGNVETSQRIADVVLKALAYVAPHRVPAAGCGTMTNVLIGGVDERGYWVYYETIGGGSGARPGKDGVSGVHVNMTNTLNTPIEIAEHIYPLLFTSYRIREGSGGRGRYRGGDGIIRSFKVLKKARLAVIADRFRHRPYGLFGGEPGEPGRITIIRSNGRVETMPSKFVTDLEPGDEVVIETPGGGGWGQNPSSHSSQESS